MNCSIMTKKVGVAILLIYIAVAVFGLLPTTQMDHHVMSQGTDCPYAVGSQSVCDMGSSHIRGWQTFSNAIIFTWVLVLAFAGILVISFSRIVLVSQKMYVRLRKWRIAIPRTMYQELFSSGILNSKNP
ncbi:MAG: hypothetical protein KBC22_03285 [Candidatus Pacebacteria bacterium]|nr:hypothetical protein [Candidatus Paceibacterota bacterium]